MPGSSLFRLKNGLYMLAVRYPTISAMNNIRMPWSPRSTSISVMAVTYLLVQNVCGEIVKLGEGFETFDKKFDKGLRRNKRVPKEIGGQTEVLLLLLLY